MLFFFIEDIELPRLVYTSAPAEDKSDIQPEAGSKKEVTPFEASPDDGDGCKDVEPPYHTEDGSDKKKETNGTHTVTAQAKKFVGETKAEVEMKSSSSVQCTVPASSPKTGVSKEGQ